MVWAWFSESGAGAIRLIDENISDGEFIQTLEEALVPLSWARFGLDPVAVLFHRSPGFILNSHAVRDWFRERQEFKLENLPMKSQDINPFETVWLEFER